MQQEAGTQPPKWALILGASSGFGAATARALAQEGYNIVGIHLDRSATVHLAEEVKADVEAAGREAVFFNANAAKPETRQQVVSELRQREAQCSVIMHSLAFGTLRPLVNGAEELITRSQLEMTLNVMGHSFVYWVQELVRADRVAEGAQILAMTSAGTLVAFPQYGAVSAAKAALESYVRQLALELAPLKVGVNAVRAGVTDTPALRKIPGHERMMNMALDHNPHGRLTTPQDVAASIAALARLPYWVTGNVINVDGGEAISG